MLLIAQYPLESKAHPKFREAAYFIPKLQPFYKPSDINSSPVRGSGCIYTLNDSSDNSFFAIFKTEENSIDAFILYSNNYDLIQYFQKELASYKIPYTIIS